MNPVLINFLNQRKFILFLCILFQLFYVLLLGYITSYLNLVLLSQNVFVAVLISGFPLLLIILSLNFKKGVDDSDRIPNGCILPPSGIWQFDYLRSILQNLLYTLRYPKNVELLYYDDHDRNSPLGDSIASFQDNKHQYIVIPPSQLNLELATFESIMAHELGHLVSEHGKYTAFLLIVELTAYFYGFASAIMIAIALQSIPLLIFLSIFGIYLTKVVTALIRKSEEYTADGFAVLAGYGQAAFESYLTDEPDRSLFLKIRRLAFPYPSDADRLGYAKRLTQKYSL